MALQHAVKPPVCVECKRGLPQSKPRISENGHWFCEDCCYLRDHPDAPRLPKHRKPKRPQHEEMFPECR